jgi:L-ascorbate metabolism protein UlaG (beta-lactamase superfamily)
MAGGAEMKVTWLGHASFRLEADGFVAYVDPYKVRGERDADAVLVTHGHHDHCDMDSIRALLKEGGKVVCPLSCAPRIALAGSTPIEAGESIVFGPMRVEAHEAYNTNKPNHPRGTGLSYVVEAGGKRIYHAGDTDLIEEMRSLGRIDLALLPVGGTYTMNAEEATAAVKIIKPNAAAPMHYGTVVGGPQDAELFRRLAQKYCRVVVPAVGEAFEV